MDFSSPSHDGTGIYRKLFVIEDKLKGRRLGMTLQIDRALLWNAIHHKDAVVWRRDKGLVLHPRAFANTNKELLFEAQIHVHNARRVLRALYGLVRHPATSAFAISSMPIRFA